MEWIGVPLGAAGTITGMPDVVMFADTMRTPELRHEVPLQAPDEMIYVERNGTRQVYASALEVPRLDELDGGLEAFAFEVLGLDELIAAGLRRDQADPELVLRACKRVGIERAAVPRTFPLGIADHLRANGVELVPEGDLFDERRRAKNESELAGIKRAARGSEQAFAAIRSALASGEDVTCEDLKSEVAHAFMAAGVIAPDPPIVSHGPQTAVGHEPGHGPIEPGEPVVADLYPQDPESGCYSDMTRTFCIGEPSDELREFHRLCKEVLDAMIPLVRPGIAGAELHRAACELFQAAGYPTQLTKQADEVLDHGFFHALGHGVGLELHEAPLLGRNGAELVVGDVVAIEPGLYRPGFGGCRLEDLVLVTEDGGEVLTDFPHDLEV